MRSTFRSLCWPLLLLLLLEPAAAHAQSEPPELAVPLDPIEGIIHAFHTHDLVAIDSGLAGYADNAFLRKLISDPRFKSVVDDIVVEFGSARYQNTIDRFVSGEDVPRAALQKVWQDTTMPTAIWDRPMFAQFFAIVRDVNASLPKDEQLRVLLGEPPIDWNIIRTQEDYNEQLYSLGNRDGYAAELIRREVLRKHRRALIIYSGLHLQRRNLFANYGAEWPEADTLVMKLNNDANIHVFTIWWAEDLEQLQVGVADWPMPSMALIADTVLGATNFSVYAQYEGERRIVRDGKAYVVPREQWQALPMEEQFDAIIYAGRSTDTPVQQFPHEACSDTVYIRERLRRMSIFDWAKNSAEELKRHCENLETETRE